MRARPPRCYTPGVELWEVLEIEVFDVLKICRLLKWSRLTSRIVEQLFHPSIQHRMIVSYITQVTRECLNIRCVESDDRGKELHIQDREVFAKNKRASVTSYQVCSPLQALKE